jgi:hypothetical protein
MLSAQVLDLQHNPELRSPELLQELCGLSNLRVLYMQVRRVVSPQLQHRHVTMAAI